MHDETWTWVDIYQASKMDGLRKCNTESDQLGTQIVSMNGDCDGSLPTDGWLTVRKRTNFCLHWVTRLQDFEQGGAIKATGFLGRKASSGYTVVNLYLDQPQANQGNCFEVTARINPFLFVSALIWGFKM